MLRKEMNLSTKRRCHNYQYEEASKSPRPILNAACKEDPARLGQRLGAVNLDIVTYDSQTKQDIRCLPHFIHGSVLELKKLFPPQHFGTIVLGELIEHCVEHIVRDILVQVHHALRDDGIFIITYPLDNRPPDCQHQKEYLKVVVEGETGHDITVWHQTVWERDVLDKLIEDAGFTIIEAEELDYNFITNREDQGWGLKIKRS